MANQTDEKAKRLIQAIIQENAEGQEIDNKLASSLAEKIVVGLRTSKIKKNPAPQAEQKAARPPAFMATPGVNKQGEPDTVVEKVNPQSYGTPSRSAEDQGAFVQGDNVDPEEEIDDSEEGFLH